MINGQMGGGSPKLVLLLEGVSLHKWAMFGQTAHIIFGISISQMKMFMVLYNLQAH
jgi:hypothetical protein